MISFLDKHPVIWSTKRHLTPQSWPDFRSFNFLTTRWMSGHTVTTGLEPWWSAELLVTCFQVFLRSSITKGCEETWICSHTKYHQYSLIHVLKTFSLRLMGGSLNDTAGWTKLWCPLCLENCVSHEFVILVMGRKMQNNFHAPLIILPAQKWTFAHNLCFLQYVSGFPFAAFVHCNKRYNALVWDQTTQENVAFQTLWLEVADQSLSSNPSRCTFSITKSLRSNATQLICQTATARVLDLVMLRWHMIRIDWWSCMQNLEGISWKMMLYQPVS